MSEFLQQLVNGVTWGSVYALIALGYTMVYGILRLINFAHGDVYMLGAFVALYASRWLRAGEAPGPGKALLVLLASMLVCALIGMVIERLAYKPVRKSSRLSALITAIGVSLVLHTRVGKAMQAVSHNHMAAALMGISVDRIITFTFMIGSALAAAAGVLVALQSPRIEPYMGILPGLKAFVAAVLGGIGNIPGAVLGGLIIGIAETFVVGYGQNVGIPSTFRDAVAFAILILVLLIRPAGLLGSTVQEKV